jgi:hypothetical protein
MVYWLVCPMPSRADRIELNYFQNLPTVSIFQGMAYKFTHWRMEMIYM